MGIAKVFEEGPWWDTGVLERSTHYMLIAKRHAIARRAGLGEQDVARIWTKLPDAVSEDERLWARSFVQDKTGHNAAFYGPAGLVRERMKDLTAGLIRNFTDGRVLGCETLMEMVLDKAEIKATVLMIPDFLVVGEMDKRPPLVTRTVLSFVRDRLIAGKPLALYAGPDRVRKYLATAYSDAMAEDVLSFRLQFPVGLTGAAA